MEPPRLLSQLRPEQINRRSRSRDGFIAAKRREPFLRRLLPLLRPAFHTQHVLILRLRYFRIPLIIINPLHVNVRPPQPHGFFRRPILPAGQPPQPFLLPSPPRTPSH